MRVLLYAKMLKETKAEETIVIFVTFLSLVAFQLGGGRPPCAPPDFAYGIKDVQKKNDLTVQCAVLLHHFQWHKWLKKCEFGLLVGSS